MKPSCSRVLQCPTCNALFDLNAAGELTVVYARHVVVDVEKVSRICPDCNRKMGRAMKHPGEHVIQFAKATDATVEIEDDGYITVYPPPYKKEIKLSVTVPEPWLCYFCLKNSTGNLRNGTPICTTCCARIL